MRQPADRHAVRNARANTSHPPAPRPHASSRDAQVATLCAPQRCTGRPGGVPGAPAAKHVTRQRHEPAARCAAPTQRATRTGGICFCEKIKPAHFRCSQPRSISMVPQRRRAPGVRGVQMHRTPPRSLCSFTGSCCSKGVSRPIARRDAPSVLARASGGDGPTPHRARRTPQVLETV